MNAEMNTIRASAITALTCALLSSAGLAQAKPGFAPDGPQFKSPVRMETNDKMLGVGRLYPSPVAHDLNGDGRFDIVVGDLRGNLTFALQQQDGTFDSEQQLKDASGKVLDFGNW